LDFSNAAYAHAGLTTRGGIMEYLVSSKTLLVLQRYAVP